MATFDIIVIGSGPAGSAAVETAKELGAERIALVESAERLGGECPNWGCVPTKALLRSVEVLELMRRAEEFGLAKAEPSFVFADLMRRKQGIVDGMTGGDRLESYFTAQLGVTLIRGKAKFIAENAIDVAGERHEAERIIVAAGARTFVPPIDGLADAGFITSDELVVIKELPGSLVIIGGGPIGVEFAQIFHSLGTKVTIVEFAPHVLSREDDDIAEVVETSFRKRGIVVHVSSKAVAARREGNERVITVMPAAGEGEAIEVRGEHLVIAAGKRPALDDMDLAAAGIETDARGMPVLDATLKSSNARVWFAGDAAGQMLFTHVAHEQGNLVAMNAMKGAGKASDLSVVPRGTFCSPEVGSVGITEKAAREKGHDVGVGKFLFAHLGRSKVSGDNEGLVKLVVDKSTRKVLGGHVVGHGASELVHEIALAMYADIPYTKIAEMIHAYPTYAEAIGAAAYGVE